MKKPPKPKRCKAPSCTETFTPARMGQHTCANAKCALEYIRAEKQRKLVREKREGLKRLRSRSDWTKIAQREFNRFIKARDDGLPCVSCGLTEHGTAYVCIDGWVASHYRSVGACPELRFEETNVHRACVRCNSHLSGNIVEYRVGLLARIGPDKLAWLEGPHEPKRYTVEQLAGIAATYRAKKRNIERGRQAAMCA